MPRILVPSAAAPLLLALAAAGCGLHGGRFTGVEENDLFNLGDGLDVDRDYTQGAVAAFTFTDVDTPGWAAAAARAVPLFRREAPVHLGLLAGQEIYTPGDRYATAPIPDDRPYAAWLWGGAAIQVPAFDGDPLRRRDRLDHLELDLGVVGPSAQGELAQNSFHRFFGIDEAEGWGNQIEGGFGFLATWETRWRIGSGGFGGEWAWDLLPRVQARAGNLRVDGAAGFLGRVGWRLPRDFGPMAVDATGLREGDASPGPWVALHVGSEVRGVLHDRFLSGSGDSPSVSAMPFLLETVAGVSAGWGGLALAFEQHALSPEFRERRRHHQFATLMASWTWAF